MFHITGPFRTRRMRYPAIPRPRRSVISASALLLTSLSVACSGGSGSGRDCDTFDKELPPITQIIDATAVVLSGPIGLALDSERNVYVAGLGSDNVFRITPGGTITQIIDAAGDPQGNGLNFPGALAFPF